MTATHKRAARRERQAARALGTRRVHRSRYERAPDVERVSLPCGLVLTVEVKTRKRLPSLVTEALAKAKGYGLPGDVPLAVLSQTGGEPLVVLPMKAFRVLAGFERAEDRQLPLPFGELGPDERRALAYLAGRLREGHARYGAINLATDPRDFESERAEVVADLLIYSAFAALKRTGP